jgi:NitT/TauT family transport system permease protein
MRNRPLLLSAVSVFAVCALWEALAAARVIDAAFFPPPHEILGRFLFLCARGETPFLAELAISLVRVLAGALIGAPLAILLAVAAELYPAVGAFLRPWTSFLYPLPKLAILPLLLVLLGLGEAPKVALVAIGVFFLVLLSTGQGIRRIMRSEYYDVALVYRIPLRQRVKHVLLRGAVPEIVNGTKMGLGYGLVNVIAAEYTASQRGIGVFLWNSWDQFHILDLYAGLLAIGLVGWVIFFVANRLEARFSRYD